MKDAFGVAKHILKPGVNEMGVEYPDHPSLRDLGQSASIPSLEKAGLCSFVRPGHQAANIRRAIEASSGGRIPVLSRSADKTAGKPPR
jgi:hypothetical protein